MLNTELMVKAKVFYGSFAKDLSQIRKSFLDAKLSKRIAKTFYKEKNILGYNTLGVGGIIHRLPINVCKQFVCETFKNALPETLEEEIIYTIFKFFENNLNISETARNLYIHRNTLIYRLEKIQKMTSLDIKKFDDAFTFKLALMIINYMDYLDA